MDSSATVLDWLAHLDVLLMPSLHEGLPYTLLEAMSLGVPAVASRVGGLAEVLRHHETGRLVDVGDVDGLARELASLAGDPIRARRLGAASAPRGPVEGSIRAQDADRDIDSLLCHARSSSL